MPHPSIAPVPAPTPVTLVTGFLGSGKTTLIARLLRHPELANTAVIVNEIGAVGLHHLLLERLDGNTMLLPQGCMCCTLNGSIGATLEGLDIRRVNGEVPAFDRVIIETTGLARTAPIMAALLESNVLMRGFTPGLIVTAVDAQHGAATLAGNPEAVEQAAMADRLLLTKLDLADGAAVRDRLAAINPGAPILPVVLGDLAPADLDGSALADLAAYSRRARSARFTATAGHGRATVTLTLRLPRPPVFADLADWLGLLAAEYGDALLRVKGIVRIHGQDRPLVVHGVRHTFYPPTLLDRWPPELDSSTLVFVLDGLDPANVSESARQAGLLHPTYQEACHG